MSRARDEMLKARATARNKARAASRGVVVEVKVAKEPCDKPRIKRDGLKWMIGQKPPRLSAHQYATAVWFGGIVEEHRRAALPGSAEPTGAVVALGSVPGPLSQWRLHASREYELARGFIVDKLPPGAGAAYLEACEEICANRITPRELAHGNDWEAVRIEEKLKAGLSLLQYGRNGGR